MSRNDGELEEGQIAPLPFSNDGSFLQRAALELRKREVEAQSEQQAATAAAGSAASHGNGSSGGNANSCGGAAELAGGQPSGSDGAAAPASAADPRSSGPAAAPAPAAKPAKVILKKKSIVNVAVRGGVAKKKEKGKTEPEAAASSTYLREMERYAKMAPEKNEGSGRALVK